jgi:transposase
MRMVLIKIRVMSQTYFKTGESRDQGLLLPFRIDDYVSADNPVRAIEVYVSSLDLAQLKFRHAPRGVKAGQPPYDPADLLKLYLYGYLNQVRSPRRLEREAGRNVELIWLLRGLVPDYRTIGKFRWDNAGPLKAANRDFVLLARALDLVGGERVAIDGAFFDGNASKASIVTRKRLAERQSALEREIEAYGALLDANDATEAAAEQARRPSIAGSKEDVAAKLAALQVRRAAAEADLETLAASGETQLSRTDPDARLLSKTGQTVSGYNVQIAVDDKHKLIVASEVVNDGNDTGQLHAMARAAAEAIGAETLAAVADCGSFNGETLKACEDSGIEAFVPEPERGRRLEKEGRFGLDAFDYDTEADAYCCPAGEMLKPMQGRKQDATGKARICYVSLRSACSQCQLRQSCLTAKADRRVIERWEHEDVIERHRARMAQAKAADMMRRRKALAEHRFGTLKCRAGYRHFLMRGFEKVRGECALMVLCYNFTRVLNIIGLDRFIAGLAKRAFYWLSLLITATVTVLRGFKTAWVPSNDLASTHGRHWTQNPILAPRYAQ